MTADLSRATSLRSAAAGDCASRPGCRGRLRPCRGSSATGSRGSGRVARTTPTVRSRAGPRLLPLPGTHPYAGVVRVLVRILVTPGPTGTVSGEAPNGCGMPAIGASVDGRSPGQASSAADVVDDCVDVSRWTCWRDSAFGAMEVDELASDEGPPRVDSLVQVHQSVPTLFLSSIHGGQFNGLRHGSFQRLRRCRRLCCAGLRGSGRLRSSLGRRHARPGRPRS